MLNDKIQLLGIIVIWPYCQYTGISLGRDAFTDTDLFIFLINQWII